MNNNRQARISGQQGEYSVAAVLSSLPSNYYIINNLLLKTPKGSTQIDHIVISPAGVFVIETKNHKGMILGDCYSKYWMQILYKRGGIARYQFYSPYYQNMSHMMHLAQHYGIPCEYIQGIIVFSNLSADISAVQCPVFNTRGLYYYLINQTQQVLSTSDIYSIIYTLENSNINSRRNESKHIRYVNSFR